MAGEFNQNTLYTWTKFSMNKQTNNVLVMLQLSKLLVENKTDAGAGVSQRNL